MKLRLKNIGVIKESEIDLSKDLIVLCGPNNTGKTYATYVAYALYRYVNVESKRFNNRITTDVNLAEIKKSGSVQIDLWKLFQDEENKLITRYVGFIMSRLSDVFDSNDTVFKNSSLKVVFDNHDYIKSKILNAEIENDVKFGTTSTNFKKKAGSLILDITAVINQKDDRKAQELFEIITDILIPEIIGDLLLQSIYNNCYIAPAERIAINLFSRQLSVQRNKLVDDLLAYSDAKSTKGILAKAQLYPLAIRDSLEVSERLSELQKDASDYGFLADLIETEILKGKIKISKEGEVQYSPQSTRVKPLGIHLTASVVKSLSNLVFYFRHIAKKGDFIIIDEPELNLHPDNQIKIAHLLARIVNNGFKVMISTHSDYIIREINNLIMLSNDNVNAKKIIKKYHYSKEELLNHNNVAAYIFNNKISTPIDVSSTGFEVETIDAEISKLNKISEEIYYNVF